jgi:hypothetical protein
MPQRRGQAADEVIAVHDEVASTPLDPHRDLADGVRCTDRRRGPAGTTTATTAAGDVIPATTLSVCAPIRHDGPLRRKLVDTSPGSTTEPRNIRDRQD